MDTKTILQVSEYRPISSYSMEELALRLNCIKPSSGVLFTRNTERVQKEIARDKILELFHPQRWDRHLHILTMPGVDWRFERLLLGARESGWMRARTPRRTALVGVENDRSIYTSGLTQMPGLHTPDALLRPITKFSEFAERAMKTRYGSYFFANIDDFMQHNWESAWDAVWLDYTGPMSSDRMTIIENFYQRCVRHVLIVTVLAARWDRRTSSIIERAGSHSQWLRNHLPGNVLHDIRYGDTVPMAQFAVQKDTSPMSLTSSMPLWFWEIDCH